MSIIGKQVEEFKATAYHNHQFIDVTEEDFKGDWTVVLFYPADFSFVCPTELGDLQKERANLKELGANVYSVSTDTHFTHMAWHEESPIVGSVEYPMIADPSQELSKMFDVLDVQGLSQRGTFIIDPDGVVQAAEINADGIGRDASLLINKIKAAQYIRKNPDQACPAKWQEGDDTLTPGVDLVGKL